MNITPFEYSDGGTVRSPVVVGAGEVFSGTAPEPLESSWMRSKQVGERAV